MPPVAASTVEVQATFQKTLPTALVTFFFPCWLMGNIVLFVLFSVLFLPEVHHNKNNRHKKGIIMKTGNKWI
jgi:hypothetical protein